MTDECSTINCPECDGEGRIAAYGCGDQAGGYADTCQECKGTGQVDPDDQPEPWPDAPCHNCAGPHHVQRCPEILAALFAPLTGAEIAQAWHRNYRRWARRILRKPASERIHAAFLYSRYMQERLPKQRYSLTIENTLVAWHRAAA